MESKGLRDTDAEQDFEKEHMFQLLGDEIFENTLDSYGRKKIKIENMLGDSEQGFKFEVQLFLTRFSEGSLFFLPIIGQVVLLVVFRYGLWSSLSFSEFESSFVALGTILSFMVTIGRQGTLYLGQKNYIMFEKMVLQMFYWSLKLIGFTFLTLLFFNFIFSFYRLDQLIVNNRSFNFAPSFRNFSACFS